MATFVYVFGPNYLTAVAGMRDAGVADVNAACDVASLESAPQGVGNVILSLAHDVPPAWVGRDLDDWTQTIMRGTSMGFAELGSPDIRMIGNQETASADLMLHWSHAESAHALRVARAIERSYAALSA